MVLATRIRRIHTVLSYPFSYSLVTHLQPDSGLPLRSIAATGISRNIPLIFGEICGPSGPMPTSTDTPNAITCFAVMRCGILWHSHLPAPRLFTLSSSTVDDDVMNWKTARQCRKTSTNLLKSTRLGGIRFGCTVLSGRVVRTEGVGSNPRIETNIGVAHYLQPFRLCAPRLQNL